MNPSCGFNVFNNLNKDNKSVLSMNPSCGFNVFNNLNKDNKKCTFNES